MAARQSKQSKVKEDAVEQYLHQSAKYVRTRPGTMLLILLTACVLTIVVIYEIYRFRSADKILAAQLAAAETPRDYERLLDRYGNSDEEALILFRYLQYWLAQDPEGDPPRPDWEKSRELVKQLTSEHTNHPITRTMMRSGLDQSVVANAHFEKILMQQKTQREKEEQEKKEQEENSDDEVSESDEVPVE